MSPSNKITIQHLAEIRGKQLQPHFQCVADPTMIRDRSETVPVSPQPAAQQRLLFALRTSILLKNTTFRAPPIFAKLTKYCACHEKWHWTFSKYCTCQEKWHLTFTKYCTCHEKWHACFILVTYETSFTMRGAPTLQTHQILRLPGKSTIQHLADNAWPIRPWSETVPRPFPSVRNPPRNRGCFSRSGRAFYCAYLSKINQILRLPRKVTLDLHQVLRLRRKVTLDLHQVLRLQRKVALDLHQACLPQKVTLDLHQIILRLPRKVALDLHQVLHLPRKMITWLYYY